jgi:hypothetical protein
MGCGNFGAPPNPPQVRSNFSLRSLTAEVRMSVSRASTWAFRPAFCCRCAVICSAPASTLSFWLFHASATLVRIWRKLGMP